VRAAAVDCREAIGGLVDSRAVDTTRGVVVVVIADGDGCDSGRVYGESSELGPERTAMDEDVCGAIVTEAG